MGAPQPFSAREIAFLESLVTEGAEFKEAGRAVLIRIGRVELPVLPPDRIIASKKATGRPKDLSILPALEDALRASRHTAGSNQRTD